MLARIDNVQALSQGTYDIGSESYRYVDFYDPEGRKQVVRLMLDDDVPSGFKVTFGEWYSLVGEVSGEDKVVKGTDRTVAIVKLRIHKIEASAAKPLTAAA